MPNIGQLLSNNGFECRRYPNRNAYAVEDLEIVHFEPMVEHIDVEYGCLSELFRIWIKFKDGVPEKPNFGLDFDADDYLKSLCLGYILKEFINENDFINELHRLNTIGSKDNYHITIKVIKN